MIHVHVIQDMAHHLHSARDAQPTLGMRASPTQMNYIIKEVLQDALSGQIYQV